MCGHTPDVVIYSMFHRNPLRGFGAPGGRNLPIPITLAIGFYNSLHYRASRDVHFEARMVIVRIRPPTSRCLIPRLHDITGCQTGLTTGCIV